MGQSVTSRSSSVAVRSVGERCLFCEVVLLVRTIGRSSSDSPLTIFEREVSETSVVGQSKELCISKP